MTSTSKGSQTPIAPATTLDHNPDYRVVSSALVVLENQLQQALLDTEVLKAAKDEALKDPLAFVQQLKANKGLPSLPRLQNVVKVPDIDWTCYQVDAAGTPSLVYRAYRSDCHVFRRNIFTAEKTPSAFAQAGPPIATNATKRLFSHVGRESVSCPLTPLATRASSPRHASPPDAASTPKAPAPAAATDHPHSFPSTPVVDTVGPAPRLLGGKTACPCAASPTNRPSTPRRGWTAENDSQLQELLTIFPQEANPQQWHKKIAAALGYLDHEYIGKKVEAHMAQQLIPTADSLQATSSRQPSAEPSQDLVVSSRCSKRTSSRSLVADASPVRLHTRAGHDHAPIHSTYHCELDDGGDDDDDFMATPKKKRQSLVRQTRSRRPTPKSNADRPSVGRAGTTRTSGYLYNVPLASLRTLDMSDDDDNCPAGRPLPSLTHSATDRASLLTQANGDSQQRMPQPASDSDLSLLEHHQTTHTFQRLEHQPTIPYFYDKDYAENAEGEFGYLN
ncbi:hypothetical protein H4R34_002243 [Dimargaris verticillata]|uniref:Uncharacterized protein n=1 Tax=Dimargaris verticillata TaxID=2761393 RepID=A0A9W8B341_9FUNG|nr:hypothetical protein H4R34_002243 [Dimargaris verticillata]